MPVDSSIPNLPVRASQPLLTDCFPMSSDPDGSPQTQRCSFQLILGAIQAGVASTAAASPLNAGGQYYIWTPRTGVSNTIVGQWVPAPFIFQCIDNSLYYALMLRLSDNQVDVVIEWRPVSWTCQNPDDSLYYDWTPYVGQDGVTINGKWSLSTSTNAGVAQTNPDSGTKYTWTPRTGVDGAIVGQWV